MSALSNTGAGSLAQILDMIKRGSNGGFVSCTSRPHDNVYVVSRASPGWPTLYREHWVRERHNADTWALNVP